MFWVKFVYIQITFMTKKNRRELHGLVSTKYYIVAENFAIFFKSKSLDFTSEPQSVQFYIKKNRVACICQL